jgi:hypothetical protein
MVNYSNSDRTSLVFNILAAAFRPRPLIDFPDVIAMPDVPILMPSEKNIILQNHSSAAGAFSVITAEPCSVCPTKAILAPNEKIFLKVTLKTKTEGTERSALIIKFDDDVRLKVLVECHSVPSTISLSTDSISFEDTFIGLQRQVPLTVEYHAIGIGKFKWKTYQNMHLEEKRKAQLKEIFEEVRANETHKCVPLKRMHLVDDDVHALVYRRIYTDEVEEVEANEEFFFRSSGFSIIPLVGQISC